MPVVAGDLDSFAGQPWHKPRPAASPPQQSYNTAWRLDLAQLSEEADPARHVQVDSPSTLKTRAAKVFRFSPEAAWASDRSQKSEGVAGDDCASLTQQEVHSTAEILRMFTAPDKHDALEPALAEDSGSSKSAAEVPGQHLSTASNALCMAADATQHGETVLGSDAAVPHQAASLPKSISTARAAKHQIPCHRCERSACQEAAISHAAFHQHQSSKPLTENVHGVRAGHKLDTSNDAAYGAESGVLQPVDGLVGSHRPSAVVKDSIAHASQSAVQELHANSQTTSVAQPSSSKPSASGNGAAPTTGSRPRQSKRAKTSTVAVQVSSRACCKAVWLMFMI